MEPQAIAVVLLVGLAVLGLVRRVRGMARGEVLCGKCPGCGEAASRCDADSPPPAASEG